LILDGNVVDRIDVNRRTARCTSLYP